MNIEIDECLKKEFVLDINSFGTTTNVEQLGGLARMIQTLMLLKPGTYPNHPEMGIGIEDYKFEFLDETTLADISERANSQIKKYIPSNLINDVKVGKVDNTLEKKNNTIGLLVNLISNLNGRDNIIITFSDLGKKGKIESKIYI